MSRKKATTKKERGVKAARVSEQKIAAIADDAIAAECVSDDQPEKLIELAEMIARTQDAGDRSRIVGVIRRKVAAYRPKEVTRAREADKERAELERRAEAIIEDAERYRIDARRAVELSLSRYRFDLEAGWRKYGYTISDEEAAKNIERNERELRDLCDRAEQGDELNGHELADLKPEAVEAARMVLALLNYEGRPDFIADCIGVTFAMAERAEGWRLWAHTEGGDDDGEFSLTMVAKLFHRYPGSKFSVEPEHDLADHISAVLRHKDTPAKLYNLMRDALNDTMTDEAYNSPAVIRVALEANQPETESVR